MPEPQTWPGSHRKPEASVAPFLIPLFPARRPMMDTLPQGATYPELPSEQQRDTNSPPEPRVQHGWMN